jgi:8-oxo-dGTP pyrophosphatase MutT (NUDIX family)
MSSFTLAEVREALAMSPKKALEMPSSFAPAAVMVLVYPKNGEHCVLLNKRSQVVAAHKGEIAFPGGRRDETDESLLDTALRETDEEMGIRREDVEVLGELDDVATNSDYLISPFVGTIPYPYPFEPSEREVAEVIEIPVSSLQDESTRRHEVRFVGGMPAGGVAYAYEGHLVFGATAIIVERFLEVLDRAADRET